MLITYNNNVVGQQMYIGTIFNNEFGLMDTDQAISDDKNIEIFALRFKHRDHTWLRTSMLIYVFNYT